MSNAIGCTLFDTAIGPCAVAWSARGLACVLLPEPSAEATLARLHARHPDAVAADPPEAVERAIGAMTALLNGVHTDLRFVELDLDGHPELHRRVWAIAREIPPGATLTYGEIARALGDPALARAVGRALGRNPYPLVVPCHRVIGSAAATGGFSAPGGIVTKMRLLDIERAVTGLTASLFD